MSKSLFNDYEAWSKEASEYADAIRKVLKPIFQDVVDNDYSVRELVGLVCGEAISLECEMVMKRAIEKRKSERFGNEK